MSRGVFADAGVPTRAASDGGAEPARELAAEAPAGASPVLAPALLDIGALAALRVQPRETLLGDWFKAGDYGIVSGRRGLGKSWKAMNIACALAQGRALGPWQCDKPRRVLYVDGEMALDDYRARLGLLGGMCENFFTLSHQSVFEQSKAALCLSDAAQQNELTRLCEVNKIDVLFLDNGACLFRGIAENKADDFRDFVENWFLDLRRRGIAVVLVLHAGRNGEIRGTSKREDAAFWIMRLDEVAGGGDADCGARFMTRFAKNRNAVTDPPPFEWHYETVDGKMRVSHKEADSQAMFLQWIRDGLDTCGEIAEEMGLSKGRVSKLATKAMNAGLIKKNGRKYEILPPF